MTFFVTGILAGKMPSLISEIFNDGHEIGVIIIIMTISIRVIEKILHII